MPTSRVSRALVVFVLVSSTGCAYRAPAVHVPKDMPAIAPSTLEVATFVDDTERPVDAKTVASVRHDTTELVQKAARARAAEARVGATVVRAHVTLEERDEMANRALARDGIAIVGLWPVLFGMIHERQKVSVEIDVETDGRTFHGYGTAERAGSLYSDARRRAIAAALDRAFADAAAH